MKCFDPNHAREILEGDVGYRFYLARELERSRQNQALASSADAYLTMAIECLLIGYDEPANQLLLKASNWLEVAIGDNEESRTWPSGLKYLDMAMCNWLLRGVHDLDNLQRVVEPDEQYFGKSKIKRDKTNVCLALIDYVDAGAYQQAVERFISAGLSPPKKLNAIKREGQLCYVLCRHRLGQSHSDDEVKTATEKFLKQMVNGWLVDGHFIRAAQWMKVIHWQEGKAGVETL